MGSDTLVADLLEHVESERQATRETNRELALERSPRATRPMDSRHC